MSLKQQQEPETPCDPTSAEGPPRRHAPRIGLNVIANLAGRILPGLLNLLFIPIYVRLLGVESYGLVGFYTTLYSLLPLLDLGLSTSLNREISRLSAGDGDLKPAGDIVRTLETVYWTGSLTACLLVISLAPHIASSWIHAERLSPATVRTAISIMGFTLALQFPFDLYAGGLMGLQRQVGLNKLILFTAVVNSFGTLGVLTFVSPTIQAYCLFQCAVALVRTGACAWLLWSSLPKDGSRPGFRAAILKSIWRFTAGVAGFWILSVILMQSDKIFLSKMLPLRQFGYYTIANLIANCLSMLSIPVYSAYFPVLSRFVASGDTLKLRDAYHSATQLMACILIPVAATMSVFSPQLLEAWTGNPVLAGSAHAIASVLIAATAISGLLSIPMALQMAYGSCRLMVQYNIVVLALFLPALFFMVRHFGAIGAAWTWLLANISYITILMTLVHRRFLRGEQRRWYTRDILPALFAALAVVLLFKMLPIHFGRMIQLLYLGLIAVLGMAAAVAVTPQLRGTLVNKLVRRLSPTPNGV